MLAKAPKHLENSTAIFNECQRTKKVLYLF